MKKDKKDKLLNAPLKKSLLIYSLIFIIVALFIVSIYVRNGKILMSRGDSFQQGVIQLQYFRELLVNFIRTGNLSFFTWNIGFGYDLFSEFAYFSFGDIFAYLSLLVPTAFVDELFNALEIIRMYFVGIAFLLYCRYHNKNTISSIVGSLMYTFSGYCVWASVTQPFFTNALIIFPFVMIGIEKIILEDKVLFYTLIIAFAFFVNFYFAFMIAIIIAIYGLALAINKYKKEGVKKIAKILGKTLLYSILGILITGVFLLPTIIAFMNSERTSVLAIDSYSIAYYTRLVSNILSMKSAGQWTFLGVSSIIMISLPWFIINRKKNYPIFITLVILIFPLLFAKIGSILSFFNFPNNRWTFMIAFFFSYITTMFVDENVKLKKKELLGVLLFVLIFFIINIIFDVSFDSEIQIALGILVLYLIYFIFRDKIETKVNPSFILISILTFGILLSNNYFFNVNGYNYLNIFIDSKSGYDEAINTQYGQISDFKKVIKYIKKIDDDFYRIGRYPHHLEDIALVKKYNAIGHYYSITPDIYGYLNMDLSNNNYTINRGAKEFDYRTKITTLLGNKYLILNTATRKNKSFPIPYGYSKIKKYKSGTRIYKNDYALPFGVLYTNYITEKEYNKLSPIEKENSLLKTTVLEEGKNYNHYSNDYNNTSIVNYKLIDDDNIVKNNVIDINDSNKTRFKLKIGKIKNSEIYISFDDLKFNPLSKDNLIKLSLTDKISKLEQRQIEKEYKWYQPSKAISLTVSYNSFAKTLNEENPQTSPYYINRSNYLFNLGYYDETSGVITVNLPSLGKYSFKNIKVYAVSMDDYVEDIEALRRSNFEVKDYGNGYLNGSVDAEEDGVLQFSTIYRDGWTIYVDGKKVDKFVSNKYFLGINITKGKHNIKMQYRNPYVIKGTVISIISLIIFGCLLIYRKKRT